MDQVGTDMRIVAGIMMMALVAGCVSTAPGAPAPMAAAPKAATAPKTAAPASGKALATATGDKRVCRSQTEIGSNFPKRICKSAAEWAAIDKANLEGVDAFKRDSQQSTGVRSGN